MPTAGLALAGFMHEPLAMQWFRNACVLEDQSDAAVVAQWEAAKKRLGEPIPRAGRPDIQALPQEGTAYTTKLVQQAWVQAAFQRQPALIGASFQLVEIEPILAYQFYVDTDRSDQHTNGDGAPSLDEMLRICLPMEQAVEQLQIAQAPGSMMLTARNLSLRMLQAGFFNGELLGLYVALTLPFVHVTRFDGRCYLHNGYHRAVGLRRRGATHLPCMVRDVNSAAEAGLTADTFDAALLESANPPTVGHFTQDRAHPVQLKRYFRTLHMSWSEYATTHE